jgi:hypothetical protein
MLGCFGATPVGFMLFSPSHSGPRCFDRGYLWTAVAPINARFNAAHAYPLAT